MNNNLKPQAIAELLDGRVFLIPAYQRGYRWEVKQVEDLISDLLKFLRKKNKKEGEFYCLQPVIVKPVEDLSMCKQLLADFDTEISKCWEVVDGQQRLTTLYILINCLMKLAKIDDNVEFEESYNRKLYHIIYETRLDDVPFLENLRNETVDTADNIDTFHMAQAFSTIENWLRSEGCELSKKLGGTKNSPKLLAEELLGLLISDAVADSIEGSVQVIWYELTNDPKINPIDEFLKINNGKIRLTDAELIKALFLLKRSTSEPKQIENQIKMGMQWELIENTLHADDFWSCFSTDIEEEDNRIELLLNMLYQKEKDGELPEEEGDLFRFYDKMFEVDEAEAIKKIENTWFDLVSRFRQMENWYADPVVYNYIGLLNRLGYSTYRIGCIFDALPVSATVDDFKAELREQVKTYLKENVLNRIEKGILNLDYKHHYEIIKSLLLFLNVNQLNVQVEALRAKNEEADILSPTYKYPFELMDQQDWDVEHIDSATTNKMKEKEEKKRWIDASMAEFENRPQEEIDKVNDLLTAEKYDEAIEFIRITWAEESDDSKDWIGNLTLLDSETNRSYGNSIFPIKREEIERRIKEEGVYVPPCTRNVFDKTYGIPEKARKWTIDDKKKYHEFILTEVQKFVSK